MDFMIGFAIRIAAEGARLIKVPWTGNQADGPGFPDFHRRKQLKRLSAIIGICLGFASSQEREVIPIPRRFCEGLANPFVFRPSPSGKWAWIMDRKNQGVTDTIWIFNMNTYQTIPLKIGNPAHIPDAFDGWIGDSLLFQSVITSDTNSSGSDVVFYKIDVSSITQASSILRKSSASPSPLLSAHLSERGLRLVFPSSASSELLISFANGEIIKKINLNSGEYVWDLKDKDGRKLDKGFVYLSLTQNKSIYSNAVNLSNR